MKPPVVVVGPIEDLAKAFEGYDKYLCRSCKSLRMGRKGVRSTHCGMCGSSDIDVETDMRSQRLEAERFRGDPELARNVVEEVRRRDAEAASKGKP